MRTRSRSLFTDFIPHNNTTSGSNASGSGGSNTNSPTSIREGKFSPTSPILQSFRTTQSLVEEDVGTEQTKTLSISLRDHSSTVVASPNSSSFPSTTTTNSISSALNGGTTTFFTPHSPSTPSPSMSTPRRRKLSLGLSSMQNINSTPPSSSPISSPLTISQQPQASTLIQGTFNQSPSPPNSTSPSSLSSSPSNTLFINDSAGSSSPRNYSPRRYSIMPAVGFATPPPANSSGSSTPTTGNSRRNSLEKKVSEAFVFPNINEKPMNNRLREIKSMELDEQMDYNSYNSPSSSSSSNNDSSSSSSNPASNDDVSGLLNYISPQYLQPAIPPQPVLERRRSFKRNPSSSSVVGDHEVPSLIPTFQRKDSVPGESFKELQRVPSRSSNLTATPASNSIAAVAAQSEEKSPATPCKILSSDELKIESSPKIITTPSTPSKSSGSSALNESSTPNRAQTPGLGTEENNLLKSLLSMELTSEMLTTEPVEHYGRRRHQEKEDTSTHDSSFDRLVSNFSSIQRQKKDVKRIPEFEEHLKEFSSLVRQFQIKGVVLNQQEIEEFLRDDRKGQDEVDPNVLSKIRSKELESYIRTLGPKTIQMMCDWRDRFHSVHENSNAVLDFSDKKKKVEENMKLMKKAMENVNAIPPARRDSLSTPSGAGGSGRRDSLPLINSSPTGSPSSSNATGITMLTTPSTPTSQSRGMTQSKSSVNMLSPSVATSYSPVPRARQRSKSMNVIKKC